MEVKHLPRDSLIPLTYYSPVSCVQAWYYFTHQTDTWPIKLLVSAVMFFDTIHQALITHTVYTYTITNWGNPAELQKLVWLVEVLFNGFTALLVQSFLAIRVWRLSNRRIALTSVVALLVLGEFGMYLLHFSSTINLETDVAIYYNQALSILVNALAAAGDVLIAATLCIILHLSRTGFHRQVTPVAQLKKRAFNIDRLYLPLLDSFNIQKLILLSICAVASLVSIVVAGHTFIYIGFFFCIGRLYTNSLLATLNARKMIRIAGEGIQTTSENLSVSLREFPKNGPMTTMRPTNISIKIDTTKEFATDSDQELDLEKSEVSVSDQRLPLLY
ncbi:hypothetical protein BYT27DRAFT_7088201 [Phlegmacium glaucopus]|nr:hypothetical protein BYT27DRAFT_7088201 [Phlegmacium glaucopus]